MGQRSSTETVAALYRAFLRRRIWSQADLARELGIGTPAVRRKLEELQRAGVPLESGPGEPSTLWRMAKDWFPGGVFFDGDDIALLLRHMRRLPRSKERDRLLGKIVDAFPRNLPIPGGAPNAHPITGKLTSSEETYLSLVEDAIAAKRTIYVRYFAASRAKPAEWRYLSPHRLTVGPPARFVATCHRSNSLKWFRVENVLGGEIDMAASYRAPDDGAIERFIAESMDGFHQGIKAIHCAFLVKEPESRWVILNTLPEMTVTAVEGGIRVTADTAGLLRLARFVVSLGHAAHVETPELAAMVAELANGALGRAPANEPAAKTLRPVKPAARST